MGDQRAGALGRVAAGRGAGRGGQRGGDQQRARGDRQPPHPCHTVPGFKKILVCVPPLPVLILASAPAATCLPVGAGGLTCAPGWEPAVRARWGESLPVLAPAGAANATTMSSVPAEIV